jgi:D-serine deaminase-like pyridoxal phosphate-dependent protein
VLLIFLDHVRENVRRVLAHLDGKVDRWRPHVKTTKIPAVMSELVRAGLRRFKCATTREAEELSLVLARSGSEGDVLVAYPLIGPSLTRLEQIAAARPGTTFSVLCEDPQAVGGIPASLGIYADVNPGMNRTGIPVTDRAAILEVGRRAGERFRGIHYYEGHLRRSDADRDATHACLDALVDLIHWLERSGLGVGEAITSGTPTFLAAAAHTGLAGLEETVHRVSPGTVVYHDLMTEQNVPDLDLLPAAVVLSRIVSHPREGMATCDAGSKTIAAEAGNPCAFVLGYPGLLAVEPSEEHLPFEVVSGPRPERGAELLLVPRHVCPTVNLAEQAILIEAGAVAGIVEVSARAHEVRILE